MESSELQLQIYNTMTRQKELFRPIVPGKVGMYVCGVTPYDYSHIGHARAYVCFDVLYRFLQHLGYDVTYVRNFTDIDDKVGINIQDPFTHIPLLGKFRIINRANQSGENPLDLSRRFSEEFLKDMDDLLCLLPTHQPRVSDHIPQIIDMIQKIIDNGCGYTIDGDVYFSVDNFPKYGHLSGRKLDDNRAGGGGRVAVDTRKRNSADFALWKSAKPGEPFWASPWGPGRPGWHIECSAMSAHYLGPYFDIHGGGLDLTFPHHENEVAQSGAALPESTVNFWMHNGFVNRDNEKMSKSLNNFFTIRDITENYHPLALRFFLMRTHYRSDINYTDRLLETASDRIYYIYQTLLSVEEALAPFREGLRIDQTPADIKLLVEKFQSGFRASMLDDLHTSSVLDDLMEPLKAMNNNLKKFKGKKQQMPLILGLTALEKAVKETLTILGLMPPASTSFEVLKQLKDKALKRAGLTEEYVLEKIEERMQARKNKEYERSDKIREDLYSRGIALMDEPKGTIWRPREPPESQFDAAAAAVTAAAATLESTNLNGKGS